MDEQTKTAILQLMANGFEVLTPFYFIRRNWAGEGFYFLNRNMTVIYSGDAMGCLDELIRRDSCEDISITRSARERPPSADIDPSQFA